MTTVKQQSDDGAAPSPSRRLAVLAGRWRRPLTNGLGIIAWPLLAFFVLAATFFLFGLLLPPVILGSLPGARDRHSRAGRKMESGLNRGRSTSLSSDRCSYG